MILLICLICLILLILFGLIDWWANPNSSEDWCPLCRTEMVPSGTCDLPPKRWFCTLEKGHEGPCPTWPNHHRIVEKGTPNRIEPTPPPMTPGIGTVGR